MQSKLAAVLSNSRTDHTGQLWGIHCTHSTQVSALEFKAAQLAEELIAAHKSREDAVQKARELVLGKSEISARQQQLEYVHKIQVSRKSSSYYMSFCFLRPHRCWPCSISLLLLYASTRPEEKGVSQPPRFARFTLGLKWCIIENLLKGWLTLAAHKPCLKRLSRINRCSKPSNKAH